MRYFIDILGKRFVDHGLGYVSAPSLGVTMNQAAINQATARMMSEGTELAILPPTCPAGSQAYPAGRQFFAPAPCPISYTRAATTVLRDGTRCVPPCMPAMSKSYPGTNPGPNYQVCLSTLNLPDSGDLTNQQKRDGTQCWYKHCFHSSTPQAGYSCLPSTAQPGTYACCD